MFEYYTHLVAPRDLSEVLNSKGAEGWRLHTCDLKESQMIFIVMDRFIPNNAESEDNEEKDEAMACKG